MEWIIAILMFSAGNALAADPVPISQFEVGVVDIHPSGSAETSVKATNANAALKSFLKSPRDVTHMGLLYLGDHLETGPEQSVTVELHDGSEINVGPGSDLIITAFSQPDAMGSTEVEMHKGIIHVLVPKNLYNAKKHFYVRTPVAVMGVRGTEFIVEHDELYGSRVHTFEGTVALGKLPTDLETAKTFVLVGAGRMSRLASNMLHPLEPALFETKEFFAKLHPRFLRHLKHRHLDRRIKERR